MSKSLPAHHQPASSDLFQPTVHFPGLSRVLFNRRHKGESVFQFTSPDKQSDWTNQPGASNTLCYLSSSNQTTWSSQLTWMESAHNLLRQRLLSIRDLPENTINQNTTDYKYSTTWAVTIIYPSLSKKFCVTCQKLSFIQDVIMLFCNWVAISNHNTSLDAFSRETLILSADNEG